MLTYFVDLPEKEVREHAIRRMQNQNHYLSEKELNHLYDERRYIGTRQCNIWRLRPADYASRVPHVIDVHVPESSVVTSAPVVPHS